MASVSRSAVFLKSKKDFVLRQARKLDSVSANDDFLNKLVKYRTELESMKTNLASMQTQSLTELSRAIEKVESAGLKAH